MTPINKDIVAVVVFFVGGYDRRYHKKCVEILENTGKEVLR